MTADSQVPSPMPRQDLSAFAPTRGVTAPKLAPRRRPESAATTTPPQTPVVPAQTTPAPAATDPTADSAPVADRPATSTPPAGPPRRAQSNASKSGQRGTTRVPPPGESKSAGQIIAYIKDPVAERMRAAQVQTRRTYLQLVIDAIDATHTELPQLLEAAGYIDRRSSSLFGDAAQGVRQRSSGERKQQIGLRPPAGVLAVIDQLVIDSGAPHRSALIEVALDAHLASR